MYYTKHTLMAHDRVHTGKKSSSYKICDSEFAVNTNLRKHMKFHEKI